MGMWRTTALLIILVLLGGATSLPGHAEGEGQERIEVGMLDPANPGGLIFVTGRPERQGAGYFGIRLIAYRPQERIEEAVFELDWSSSTLVWQTGFDGQRPVTLRWSRLTPQTIGAQISGPPSINLAIELYEPFVDDQRLTNQSLRAGFLARTDRQTILGEQINTGAVVLPRPRLLLRSEVTADGAASYRDRDSFRRELLRRGQANNLTTEPLTGRFPFAALSYDLSRRAQISLTVTLGSQWEVMEREIKTILQRPMPEQIRQAVEATRRLLPVGRGRPAEEIDRLTAYLGFNRLFDPVGERTTLVTRRETGGGEGRAREINVETLLLAAMSAPFNHSLATSTLRHILSGQLNDGRIPANWQVGRRDQLSLSAGRSMLPVGAMATLRIYRATNDLELLGWAFPRLLLWNDWWLNNRGDGQLWRDGNRDGLPEWGYNENLELGSLGREQLSAAIRARLAISESGRQSAQNNGSVFNEEAATLEENSIALSSLLALDLECLSLIARELGLTVEAARLERRHEQMCQLINNRLWDEEAGSYVDRRWSGQPVRQLRAENLLPLVAGLPDPERLRRIMATSNQASLLSASAEAPLPIACLLYLGLRRYGRHSESAAVANSFRAALKEQGNSPLADWPVLEEIFSLDPLTGLSLGSIAAGSESTIERLQIGKDQLTITFGPERTVIQRNGVTELEGAGAARIRGYRQQPGLLTFSIETSRPIELKVPGEKGRKITVSLDNDILGSTSIGAAASFRVSAGAHRILVVK